MFCKNIKLCYQNKLRNYFCIGFIKSTQTEKNGNINNSAVVIPSLLNSKYESNTYIESYLDSTVGSKLYIHEKVFTISALT